MNAAYLVVAQDPENVALIIVVIAFTIFVNLKHTNDKSSDGN